MLCTGKIKEALEIKPMATTSNIQDLPTEILLDIMNCLTYGYRISLSITNKKLYAVNQLWNRCNPRKVNDIPEYGMDDRLHIEQWPIYCRLDYMLQKKTPDANRQDAFACSICLRIRESTRFSRKMVSGKSGKFATSGQSEKGKRLCISCGVASKRYPEGTILSIGRERLGSGQTCGKCSGFRVGWIGGDLSLESEKLVLLFNSCTCPQGIIVTSLARRSLELCS